MLGVGEFHVSVPLQVGLKPDSRTRAMRLELRMTPGTEAAHRLHLQLPELLL